MRRARWFTPAVRSLLRLLVAAAATLVHVAVSDFVFPNFLDTTGLIFNGDAYTTSCTNNSRLMYGAQQQLVQPAREPEVRIAESTDVRETVTTETNPPENAEMTYTFFGHREVYDHSPVDEVCDNRIRMTASEPHQLSSVWYTQGLEVLSGFECSFQFQVTDQSRVCRNVQTADFNIYQYKACKVHGGDGFAFVIQSNENGTATLGQGAESMGYGGIGNSLAVEFDTWTNSNFSDLWYDHISVHSMGTDPNIAAERGQLGIDLAVEIGDGKIHAVKVRYFPTIQMDMLSAFTASEALLPFIKDNGEGKRIGTLAVYYDDDDFPILALPINLSVLLKLDQGRALLGFTAATGLTWEKHDILSWQCCEEPPCNVSSGIQYFESGENVSNTFVENNRTFRVVEPSFGIRPDYNPANPPEGDGPYGPVDSDDRYAPPEEYADRVTDYQDEHNQPGQELPGTGSHYDEVFDDGATDPKPMTRRLVDDELLVEDGDADAA